MKFVFFWVVLGLVGGGELRAHSPHDHIEAFAVSPDFEKDGTVLIVMRNHLFRSADGGKTWRRIAQGLDNRYQFMSAAMGGGTAYLASKGDGVFRSMNGGESWERANEGFGTSNIRGIHVAGGKRVFASSKSKGVYGAEVGKEVWKQVLERGEEDRVTALGSSKDGTVVVAGDELGGVSISIDGGEKWLERKVIDGVGPIFSVIAWGNGGALLGTEKKGVVLLGSDGSVREVGKLEGGAVTALAESATGGIYATTWDGGVFFRATDDGPWEPRNKGTSKHVQADERKLPHFTDLAVVGNTEPGSVFLGAYDGLFRSDDGGKKWGEIETLPLSMILDFDVADAGDGNAALLVGTYWRGPVLSLDGGTMWKALGLGLAEGWRVEPGDKIMRVQSAAFSPNFGTDGTIYVGGRNTLFVSKDRGDSWGKIDLGNLLGEDDLIVDRIAASALRPKLLLVAARAGHDETRRPAIFRSEDGGETFKKVHEGDGEYAQSLALAPNFGDGGWAVWSSGNDRGGQVYASADLGVTWKEWGEGLEMDVQGAELVFSDEGTVLAGTSEGLFRREVYGSGGWEKVAAEGLPEGGWVEAIDVSPDGESIAVAVRGHGHFIASDAKSGDGLSFRPLGEDGLIKENHLLTKAWYYSPGRVLRFSPHFGDDGGMFGTTGMVVVRSGDSGATWEELDGARKAADALEGIVWGKLWPGVAGIVGLVVLLGVFWRWRRRGKGKWSLSG